MKLAYTITQIDGYGCRREIPVFVRRPHRVRAA